MSMKRGYSDSKIPRFAAKAQIVPNEEEGQNLNNFLPNFLIDNVIMNNKKEKEIPKDTNEFNRNIEDEMRNFFDPNEADDMSQYLQHLSIKENLDPQNYQQLKVPRGKLNSSVDLKKFASDYKSQMSAKLQNQIQNSRFNINYNINQNISQNINKSGEGFVQSKFQGNPGNTRFYPSHYGSLPGGMNFSPQPSLMTFNDSGNFVENSSFYNGFVPIRPEPKRTNSFGNMDQIKGKSVKASLFMSSEKEEKGDDFEDLNELLKSISCDLWNYAKTQKGSRNLQKLLNTIQPEGLDTLLEKLKDHLPELMIDTYGNYFCQKMIQCCSHGQRMFILSHIMKEFTEIACNASGTHSIQSLIEIVNMPGEEELVKEAVRDNILTLSYNINGTHVIQKVLSCIDEDNREHINTIIMNNISKLVYDSNGICVLKKFINGNKNRDMRNFLLGLITTNALEIVQNPFGNYVIQHILDEWGPSIAKDIIEVITQNIISLSMQKFSSNVVEKCFDIIDKQTKKRMIKELFNAGKISSLLKNKYGSFVLQKALQIMEVDERKEIKEYLRRRVPYTSNKEKVRLAGLIDII